MGEQPMSGQQTTGGAFTAAMRAIDLLMAGEESEAFLLLAKVDIRDLVLAHVIVEKLGHFLTGLLIHKVGATTAHIMLGSALTAEMSGFDRGPKEGETPEPEAKPDGQS